MNAERVLSQLRRFLLFLAILLFVGTAVELWFTDNNHLKEPVQMIPYILSGLGVGAILVALTRPARRTLLLLWGVMGVVALGSLVGMVEHIESNLGFYLEVHPAAAGLEMLMGGLRGASPLLAPGVLALGAVLAVAATYQHPAIASSQKG